MTEATARLTVVVESIPWVGPDRERFVAEWNGTHRPGLLGLIADLGDAARAATLAADAQESASADRGSGS